MAVEIKRPTVLRAHADGQATVAVDGSTVGEVFDALIRRYPALRGNLLDDAGGLHKFVNVYKDDDDIRYLDGLEAKVDNGDVISALPAVLRFEAVEVGDVVVVLVDVHELVQPARVVE